MDKPLFYSTALLAIPLFLVPLTIGQDRLVRWLGHPVRYYATFVILQAGLGMFAAIIGLLGDTSDAITDCVIVGLSGTFAALIATLLYVTWKLDRDRDRDRDTPKAH